jgi:hypothetical protein
MPHGHWLVYRLTGLWLGQNRGLKLVVPNLTLPKKTDRWVLTTSAATMAVDWSTLLTRHRGSPPAASRRRRRWSTAPGDARLGYFAPGLHEEPYGSDAPSKRSPERTLVNPSAVAHGGGTTSLSYGAWFSSKISWEDAYAHPEAAASLAEVGDGRRWVNHHGFRRATGKGNDQILKIATTKAWFLSLGCYSSSGASPRTTSRARSGLKHRCLVELQWCSSLDCGRQRGIEGLGCSETN